MSSRVPLTEIGVGQTVRVVEIEGGHGVRGRLCSLGIRPGVELKKISGSFGGGPIVVQVVGSQTAVGRGVAAKIVVEEAP